MSNLIPDSGPFERLRSLISAEEDRTQQYARLARISREVADSLSTMKAADWHAASRGFTSLEFCERLADDFLRKGSTAANGLSISVLGPVLEVAEDAAAPQIEIRVGIPYQ